MSRLSFNGIDHNVIQRFEALEENTYPRYLAYELIQCKGLGDLLSVSMALNFPFPLAISQDFMYFIS